MENLAKYGDKRMTVREVAEAMGISIRTVHNAIDRLFPDIKDDGKTTYLTEYQVGEISREVKEKHNANLASTGKVTVNEMKRKAAEVMAWLMQENEIMRPKAEAYDRIADSTGLKTLQEVADILGYGPNTLFNDLRGRGIIYKTNDINLPKREHIEAGRLEVKESTYKRNGKEETYTRIFVTPKGMLWLEKILKE
jgi:phage antirepressor YoqD-like protein